MISPEYRTALINKHKAGSWGGTGARYAGQLILDRLLSAGVTTGIDFGAGQGTLKHFIEYRAPQIKVSEYDPGVSGKDVKPAGTFDAVISSDVLEHVEPEMIEETIAWMQSHSDRFLYHHIACDPAGITLPDGRNVHLITEGLDWWMDKFTDPNWQFMEVRDCWQQKRGYFRHHIHVRLDKCSAGPPRYVPSDYQA